MWRELAGAPNAPLPRMSHSGVTGVRELGSTQEGLRANTAPGQAPAMRPRPRGEHQPPGKQPSLFEAQEAPMAEQVGGAGWDPNSFDSDPRGVLL